MEGGWENMLLSNRESNQESSHTDDTVYLYQVELLSHLSIPICHKYIYIVVIAMGLDSKQDIQQTK